MTGKTRSTIHALQPDLQRGEKMLWQGAPEQEFGVGFIQIIALLVLGVWIGGFVFNIPEMLGNDAPKLAIVAGVIASLFAFVATVLGPWQKRQCSLLSMFMAVAISSAASANA